jgi:cytosine/adenosine deaminase-related metal-dependent hydrolase
MRENGLDIAVGTDSLSSNDDLSMIGEIACLHRNFPEVPMNEIFTWASLNGARFLSKEESLGSLAVGKRPGIVLVTDMDAEGCVTDSSTTRRLI